MPELPEVETVRRYLKSKIIDKTIIDIEIYYSKIIKEMNEVSFVTTLINKKFTKIDRTGKYLIFKLDEINLVVHLRMEGKFFYYSEKPGPNKHTHLIFTLADKENQLSYLVYNDVRKFGTMHLVKEAEINTFEPLQKLGIEPLDSQLTADYLKQLFKTLQKDIKEVLLDQTKISGLGNIYVDEILFAAKINPRTKADTLTNRQLKQLVKNMKEIITKAIQNQGTTIRTFTFSEDQKGHNQNNLKVYGRAGENCMNCQTILKKTKITGRGTTYCPVCQKEKNDNCN